MRKFILLFFVVINFSGRPPVTTVTIISWNLKDFGKTKSADEINFIAATVKPYDIVLIQEVVAKDPGGAQAVGRLAEALNRLGATWDYRISDPTSGESSYKKERYAFLWKTSKVKLEGKPWLEKVYEKEIDREPFYATFIAGDKKFTLVNFHAITKSMQPEKEVKYFKELPAEYPRLQLIFCGDFNLPQHHTVFNPLKKMGYTPALKDQKTSLKNKCAGEDCLASEFDNVFYPGGVTMIRSGVIHFYKTYTDAQHISDHVPVYVEFQ